MIPSIEIKVSRNYSLYDFLLRLSYYGPYENERILYGERLRRLRRNFFEFLGQNKEKGYEFFLRNVSTFDNKYFRKMWNNFFPFSKVKPFK